MHFYFIQLQTYSIYLHYQYHMMAFTILDRLCILVDLYLLNLKHFLSKIFKWDMNLIKLGSLSDILLELCIAIAGTSTSLASAVTI